MGIFLPADIRNRVSLFMAGSLDFPFVRKDEVMAAFYLFGKDNGVADPAEIETCKNLARTAAEQLSRDVRLYQNMPSKMDPEFTRQNYTKRSLQIVVEESQDNRDSGISSGGDMNKRVAGDPAILSDCFAQHMAYHGQNFCFELFGPLSSKELPLSLKGRLEGRMVLLSFNAKSPQFKRPLLPFFNWMNKSG